MTKRELHEKAINLRLSGMSYSQIKKEIGVSKGTLSGWLSKYPLSEERIQELRSQGNSGARMESYRNTRARQRKEKFEVVYKEVRDTIGKLTDREILLCGLFLYWGEGGKTRPYGIAVTNTDPSMIRFSMVWMELLGIPRSKLKVHLHLYSDMDFGKEMRHWSVLLGLPLTAFRKPYIKISERSAITYTQKFTHGTCNLTYDGAYISQRVHAAMRVLQDKFAGEN